MDEKRNIEYEIADIISGRPYGFSVGKKPMCIYPVTLAKTFMLKRHMDELGIDKGNLMANPYLEAMRLVSEKKRTCCDIISVHTSPNTYRDLYNMQATAARRNLLGRMDDRDLATVLIHVLMSDKTDMVMRHLKLDKEQERMKRVMDVKRRDGKNNISFGGITIFGSFIGQLKEMGYSDSEILYERGYSFLRLMLADKMNTLYLSDEELAQLPALTANTMDANDPSSAGEVISKLSKMGIKQKQ